MCCIFKRDTNIYNTIKSNFISSIRIIEKTLSTCVDEYSKPRENSNMINCCLLCNSSSKWRSYLPKTKIKSITQLPINFRNILYSNIQLISSVLKRFKVKFDSGEQTSEITKYDLTFTERNCVSALPE